MDTNVIVAIIALAASFVTGALAIFGNKSKYPSEYVDDVSEDNHRLRKENDLLLTRVSELRSENQTALEAAAKALLDKGEVERYARDLEERVGVPHRRWIDNPSENRQ